MKSAVAAELLAWARAQRSCCPSSPYPLRRSWSTIVLGRWPQSLPGRAPARYAESGANLGSVGYAAAVLRLLSVLVLLVIGSLVSTAGSVSAGGSTRVNVREDCSYKLLADRGVTLTTSLTLSNARGGRSTSVEVIAGWSIGRLYPKAETAVLVRLGPGQTVRRVVTRTITSAPKLWEQLRAGGVKCASSYSYKIP